MYTRLERPIEINSMNKTVLLLSNPTAQKYS